jgi:pyridoxal phosphate enzyme, yggS family
MRNRILSNKAEIENRIAEAKTRGGFSHDVIIVAVTKYQTIEDTNAAIEVGLSNIGENYVQHLKEKDALLLPCKRHFIGHLQTNKVKALLSMKDIALIQSVDSVKLATEIDKYSEKLGRTTEILLQVNIGDEEQKFGVEPADTVALVRDVSDFEHIKVKGLMATMPIEKDIRYYKEFKELFEKVKACNISGVDMDILSMGMSNDFEEAVECGSNMVRIGTALFK